ncbi:hypothetical protein ACIGXG_35440 [Streptomyces goshikiensis]|uniref:hypothetical protein n=1 Tax=Streptomyces goshikiensis TaxID=1942 RepID=UPI0037D95E83
MARRPESSLLTLREALDDAKPWTWDTLEHLLIDAYWAKARARPRTEFAEACRGREAFEREGIPI